MKFRRLLRPLQLTAIMFFTVSGGPYGLEPLLHHVGGRDAIALLLLTPLCWSVPVILMVLELNGMMPVEGGYYQWVKKGLGVRWGFLEGWWTWIFTMTDLAIYPVLFVEYLTFFFPQVAPWRTIICLGVIWMCTLLNLKGILPVGRSSVSLGIAVLIPFLILFACAFLPHQQTASTMPIPGAAIGYGALFLGLFNVLWNFQGWDNGFTIAEEVQSPVRSYVTAIAISLAVITGMYILAVSTGILSGIDPALLEEEGFPALGMHIGGWWLGALLAAGGMASALGLFVSILLVSTRIPKVMADDRLLPAFIGKLHPTREVPTAAILLCGGLISLMILWDFSDLLILDVILYSAALFPEFAALIAFRKAMPDASRPFRIPLNRTGLIILTVIPFSCIALAVTGLIATGTSHLTSAYSAFAVVATGPLLWSVMRKRSMPQGHP
jgi:amino acid transporter